MKMQLMSEQFKKVSIRKVGLCFLSGLLLDFKYGTCFNTLKQCSCKLGRISDVLV